MQTDPPRGPGTSPPQTATRWLLGGALLTAGLGHLTWLREEFQAQVPSWFPADPDLVVVVSGAVELVLGAALVALPRHRVVLGWMAAAFFVVIFPSNVAQYVEGTDAFGLTSDRRGSRSLVLVGGDGPARGPTGGYRLAPGVWVRRN